MKHPAKFGSANYYIDVHTQIKLYVDEDAKWKTRDLRQMHTADPVSMGRKL